MFIGAGYFGRCSLLQKKGFRATLPPRHLHRKNCSFSTFVASPAAAARHGSQEVWKAFLEILTTIWLDKDGNAYRPIISALDIQGDGSPLTT
jgi:hypothetical protein